MTGAYLTLREWGQHGAQDRLLGYHRLPDRPAKQIHDLLPWNWRRQSIAAEAA